jgi:hypothetical protein
MSEYRLSDSFCSRSSLRSVAFAAALAILFLLIISTIAAFQPDVDSGLLLKGAMIFPPLFLLLMCFVLCRTYFFQRAVLRNFRIFLDHEGLTRTAGSRLAEVTIFRDEVMEIIETQETGLKVFPKDRFRAIFIPMALIGYEEVRGALSEWKEMRIRPKPPLYHWALALGGAALLLTVWLALPLLRSPYLVVPCGSAIIALLLSCIWFVQRSPHFNKRTKLLSWGWFLSIVFILLKIVMAWGLLDQP